MSLGPEIRVPVYHAGRVGAWELKHQFQLVLRGYFRRLQTAAENYLLTRDDRVWMSLSPVEIESLAPHVPHMRGHAVIAGLGMGLALYNAPLRHAVRRISVVERDPGVIALFEVIRGPNGHLPTVSRSHKPTPFPGGLPSRSTISTPTSGKRSAPRKRADTRAMCRNLRPKSAGYRGMEANFVSFLARNRCKPSVTRPQFRAWARALGVPIAAYDNRAWRERIPDVATQLIFGGSPRLNARASG